MGFIDIFNKSKENLKEIKENTKSTKQMISEQINNELDLITYNSIGFIGLEDGCNVPELIQNVATSFKKDKTVCILDLEDNYPKITKIFGVKYDSTDKGLLKVLLNDKTDVRDHFLQTAYKNISLLTFSELLPIRDMETHGLEDTIRKIRALIEDLKDRFDIVLVNIPNHPFSEYMYAGIVSVDKGFMVFNQQVEWVENYFRLNQIVHSMVIGIGGLGSFKNVICNNYLGIADDFEVVSKLKMNLVAVLPHLREVIEYSSEGKSYIGDASELDRTYVENMQKIIQLILADN